jgi:hypothetical protein
MRERAVLIGGALAIDEAPAGGVEVRLVVPLTRTDGHDAGAVTTGAGATSPTLPTT